MRRSGRKHARVRMRVTGRRTGRAAKPTPRSVWCQVVEALPEAIAVVDQDGCIVATNEAFRSRIQPSRVGSLVHMNARDEFLLLAIRSAAWGPPTLAFRATSSRGVLFDCRRIGEETRLVALIAQAMPKRASGPGDRG